MRPLQLTLEGFRSYADRATFNFRDRSLVGVVGPTGSGKSTILDALAFALYGSTPSLGAKATKPLVHKWDPRSNDAPAVAQVELWFEVGGATYRIQRQIRPKGQGGQKLERWDAIDGVLVETLSDKVKDISTAVEDLTGLDYDGFCRAVLLAQNQFQQLLMATRREAGDVLTGLLGFGVVEQMQKLTRARLDHTKGELAAAKAAEAEHDELEAATAQAREDLEAATERRDELVSVADDVAAADAAIAALSAEVEASRAAVTSHEAALASLPSPSTVDEVANDATHHGQLVAAAEAAVEEATAALARATESLDAAHAADTPLLLGKLESAIAAEGKAAGASAKARMDLAEAEQGHEAALAEADDASGAETEAGATVEAATVAAEEADGRLAALEAAHAAHLLAEDLAAGEPCPVCRQTVAELPTLDEVVGLEDARQSAAAARRRLADATEAHQRVRQRAQMAEAAVAHAADRLVAARAAAEAAGREASDAATQVEGLVLALGRDPSDPGAALRDARRAYDELKAARQSTGEAVARSRQALAQLVETDALAPLTELVAQHGEVAAALGIDWDAPDEPEAAGPALAEIRHAIDAATAEARAAAAGSADRLASALDERSKLLTKVGLDGGADYGAATTQASTAVEVAAAVLGVKENALAKAAGALASVHQKHALELRLQHLHGDLAPGNFPQYLIDEKRRDLVASGSEWLRLLSADRYELATAGDEFAIRDLTAAGLVRHPRTLSGGETFLASLALALGLATVVGIERGAAEAFFIDEGFGSLDADSLDLAMEGIERLVGGDDRRLVVVVSHVPEMRARLEDLIVLGKDEVTGATVVHRA